MQKWSQLARLGQNRLIRSSYIWLIIVPVFAKATSTMDDTIHLSVLGTGIDLSTQLPFNWKTFYAAALLGALGSALFSLFCPDINKFRSFSQFESSGLGVRYLRGVVKHRSLYDKISRDGRLVIDRYNSGMELSDNDDIKISRSESYTLFWDIYYQCSNLHPVYRFTCALSFYASISLCVLVAIENAIFVYNSS